MNIEFIKFLRRLDIPAEYENFSLISLSVSEHLFAKKTNMQIAMQFNLQRTGILSPIVHLQLKIENDVTGTHESFYYANPHTMTKAQKKVNDRMAERTWLSMAGKFPVLCKEESQFLFRLFDLCGLPFLKGMHS